VKRITQELSALPMAELERRLHDAQDDLVKTQFQLATRKMSNYARLKTVRKEIARLKFFIDEQRSQAADAL